MSTKKRIMTFKILFDSWPCLWPLHTRDKMGWSAVFNAINQSSSEVKLCFLQIYYRIQKIKLFISKDKVLTDYFVCSVILACIVGHRFCSDWNYRKRTLLTHAHWYIHAWHTSISAHQTVPAFTHRVCHVTQWEHIFQNVNILFTFWPQSVLRCLQVLSEISYLWMKHAWMTQNIVNIIGKVTSIQNHNATDF